MLQTRLIPLLLLSEGRLVKTTRYRKKRYIGDPSNTVRIFNELEADEIIILDITRSNQSRPDFQLLEEIANEAFMPMAYGGGISSFADAQKVFKIGFEKVILNNAAIKNKHLITEIADVYGSQAVVVAIDVKFFRFFGKRVMKRNGRRISQLRADHWASQCVQMGAGEILVTSVDHEGLWNGVDIELIDSITRSVSVPVIAHGGIGSVNHIHAALEQGGAHGVAIGSAVIFQKKDSGVLINFKIRDNFLEEVHINKSKYSLITEIPARVL